MMWSVIDIVLEVVFAAGCALLKGDDSCEFSLGDVASFEEVGRDRDGLRTWAFLAMHL